MTARQFLPVFDVLMLAAAALCLACGGSGGQIAPFRSEIDGDRPIALTFTDRVRSWAGAGGDPSGVRWTMLEWAAPIAASTWNPKARGTAQAVAVDIDDNTVWLDESTGLGPCLKNKFSAWSVNGKPQIYLCPTWVFCDDAAQAEPKTLFGPAGCLLVLLHELGHVLGAQQHAEQQGRALHGGGPIMCGWESDCQNPALTDYSAEDVALICSGGGHGGRCP